MIQGGGNEDFGKRQFPELLPLPKEPLPLPLLEEPKLGRGGVAVRMAAAAAAAAAGTTATAGMEWAGRVFGWPAATPSSGTTNEG